MNRRGFLKNVAGAAALAAGVPALPEIPGWPDGEPLFKSYAGGNLINGTPPWVLGYLDFIDRATLDLILRGVHPPLERPPG